MYYSIPVPNYFPGYDSKGSGIRSKTGRTDDILVDFAYGRAGAGGTLRFTRVLSG